MQNQPGDKDPELWELAKKRASFKSHLATYLIVNAFLWALWFFTDAKRGNYGWPWPLWPTLGWGIGIAFHYVGAYVHSESTSVEKEYDKLKRNKNK
jgi:hypothetical protein